MILKTLIKTNAWLSVKTILLKLYPEEEQNIEAYENVFYILKTMGIVKSRVSIDITNQKDDYDGLEYIDVSGKYKEPKDKDEEFSQAIEFTAWNEWLGMDMCEHSLDNFNELEIIAHCLYEMTFFDFDEEEIQAYLSNFKQKMDKYKSMSEEEKKANTISLENLRRKNTR